MLWAIVAILAAHSLANALIVHSEIPHFGDAHAGVVNDELAGPGGLDDHVAGHVLPQVENAAELDEQNGAQAKESSSGIDEVPF